MIKKYFSRYILGLFVLPLLLLALVPVKTLAVDTSADASADTKIYKAQIIDDADLLSKSEEKQLLPYLEAILDSGNAVVSTCTLSDGANYEKHAEDKYYELYGNEPGVLFQIDMGNRKLTLSASTGMEDLIGRERSSIVDNIYKYATNGDYLSCCSECFSEIRTVLDKGAIAHTMKYIDNAILAVIFALIVNFIIIFSSATKKKNYSEVILKGSMVSAVLGASKISKGKRIRIYDPPSSSSGGGSSGGGGGGGGFSGGSSSHGF